MNKLALIVSYFLPKRIKYYAMLDWMDECTEGTLTVENPRYILHIHKIQKES
jgi:hypothetical protein